MVPHDPFQGLPAFIQVAQTLSFSVAAARLGVTPGALSQQIKRLEQRLQTQLFQRNTRSVRLTDAGAEFLARIQPALNDLMGAQAVLPTAASDVRGSLRLTAPILAAPILLSEVLAEFSRLYPEVVVEVSLNDQFVNIIEEGFDAGIRLGRSVDKDMIGLRLTNDCAVAIAATPAYLQEHGIPRQPEDLLAHNCLRYRPNPEGPIQPWDLQKGRKSFRVPVNGRLICNHYAFTLKGARLGLGLAYVLPSWLIEEDLRQGRLVAVLEAYCGTYAPVYLYYPSREFNTPPLKAFISHLKSRAPLR